MSSENDRQSSLTWMGWSGGQFVLHQNCDQRGDVTLIIDPKEFEEMAMAALPQTRKEYFDPTWTFDVAKWRESRKKEKQMSSIVDA